MTQNGYFSGGVAVITGAGSGLGAAMATRFAAQGMPVAVLDIDEKHAERTAQRIRDESGRALAYKVDVSDPSAMQAAASEVENAFGHCSVLCANVGVQQFGTIDRLTENDWRWVLNVNVMGVIHTVNAFLPLVRKSQARRHIVITSSSAAYSPGIRMGAYTTSKYAITGYGETLRMELASEGVGVSILFPAGMATTHLQSSQKARPAELGVLEIRREDIDAMMQSRKVDIAGHVATAEYATRHLLSELAENRRYIITHGDCREAIVSNFDDLLAAHDRAQLD
jgi:NAD(P)-dependent dehydrogenase (short-subunit alcohol dehydrogenase family)